MMLQTILYGTWMPPEGTTSRVHRVGLSDGHRYEPPKPHPKANRNAIGLTLAEQKAHEILLRAIKPVTSVSLARKMKANQNTAGTYLAKLYKMGLATRHKVRMNGTLMYCYEPKEKTNGISNGSY